MVKLKVFCVSMLKQASLRLSDKMAMFTNKNKAAQLQLGARYGASLGWHAVKENVLESFIWSLLATFATWWSLLHDRVSDPGIITLAWCTGV